MRGIGRGPADAEFFQLLDQARFGIARRRFGEMLLLAHVDEAQRLAFGDRRQAAVLAVPRRRPGPPDRASRKPSNSVTVPVARRPTSAVGRGDIDGGALLLGQFHLAGEGALPDQVVELRADPRSRWRATRSGVRAKLVGRIASCASCAFFTCEEYCRGARAHSASPKRSAMSATRFGDGFARHGGAVGAHIGNEAHRLAADVDAFVKALGDLHGARGAEAELARGLLLQGGGDERRPRGGA